MSFLAGRFCLFSSLNLDKMTFKCGYSLSFIFRINKGRPKLYTMSTHLSLQHLLAFPNFISCPIEDGIDLQYYRTEDGSYFRPSRHWCLFAEIGHVDYFMRLRLRVRDRSGHEFPVAFYPEGLEKPTPEHYKIGHTIAILYPHQHYFLDMTTGIRQEDTQSIQVTLGLWQESFADIIGHPTSFGRRR